MGRGFPTRVFGVAGLERGWVRCKVRGTTLVVDVCWLERVAATWFGALRRNTVVVADAFDDANGRVRRGTGANGLLVRGTLLDGELGGAT